ncbi:helix-turn-helix domain-containing protein [Halovenus marina]|uniref:helix-turn-helix domain-containing protein n=1 Tax=Halovenus marina TaxID=3396621 RepID=UPI003F570038
MNSGIRATIAFSDPGDCPIAAASRATGDVIEQVSTSVGTTEHPSVSEFLVKASDLDDIDAEPTFSYGAATVFRTRHEGDPTCPCELLGQHGCPVHRQVADDGTLTLVFHVSSFEQLQTIVEDLRESYPPIDVQRLLQPPLEGPADERVFVNRGRLTDKQREVLEAAFEMGYFQRPKESNATEIAEALDITQSTFTGHLMAAQRKLLEDILD